MQTRYWIPVFFGLLGVIPHLIYSFTTGSLSWMEYAWDENTYVNFYQSDVVAHHRLWSFWLFRALSTSCTVTPRAAMAPASSQMRIE